MIWPISDDHLDDVFEFFKEQYDFGIINAALWKASRNQDSGTHIICATHYYMNINKSSKDDDIDESLINDDDQPMENFYLFEHMVLEGMKKYRIQTAVLTMVEIFRETFLIASENRKYVTPQVDFYQRSGLNWKQALENC